MCKCAGEIVGIAGVAGNGQDELLALLSGEHTLPRVEAATIRFAEQNVADLRPDARRKLGLAFVPAERLGHGAVPELSLADNALLTAFQQGLVSNGLIQRGKVEALAQQIIQRFGVKLRTRKPPRAACPAATCRNSSSVGKFFSNRNC